MARIPKAVEKQAQLAEDLYQQAYGNTGNPAPVEQTPEGVTPQNQDATPPAEPPAAPADGSTPDQNTPAPAEPPKQENDDGKQKPKFPDADPNSNTWEQKYKVIANKYSAEIPRYAQEVRGLKERVASLEAKLSEAQSQPSQSAPVQKVKPEEIEEYGDKFYDFVKRAASEVVPAGAGNNEVEKLKESVEEMSKAQQRIARTKFFEELGKLAPQWEAQNTDQDFLTWLNGIDVFTGKARQDLFDEAYEQLDAWRVANFFNGFSSEQPPKEPEPNPRDALEQQVVPSSNRAVTPPPSKKFWTTAEVARFYDGMRRGDYSEDEAARIEKDIFAAQSEGRFR